MEFLINHFYIFLAISFGVVSQLIIKWKMSNFPFDNYETITDKFIFAFSMLFNPYIVVSLIFTLLAGVTWMITMTKFDLSYAYPFTTLGLVFVSIFSVILFGESISWNKILGLFLIILGLIISSKGL